MADPEQVIDLTAESASLRYVEVHTAAGIVRVNTGLVRTRTGQQVVAVEVEPNTAYRAKTPPGGQWEPEVRQHLLVNRVDITLTRQEEVRANG